MSNPFIYLKEITPNELQFLNILTADLDPEKLDVFTAVYSTKRKMPNEIMLFAALGFLGVSGIHRFILGQVFLGIIYLLTIGFFFIGTIIDMVNSRSLAQRYNEKMAFETMKMIKGV